MKHLALLFALLLSGLCASAQEIFIGADFDTRFDNREDSGCLIDDSGTYFGLRLTPKAGLVWAEKNRLVVAVDLFQHFGDDHGFLSRVRPQIYYQFDAPKVRALAGIFPRSLLLGHYHSAFFDSAYAFYNNRIQGLGAHYLNDKGSFVEFYLDWVGMQAADTREQFRILSAGEYKGSHWYAGYALSVQHFAKSATPDPEVPGELPEGVVDNMLVNPYVGYRCAGRYEFSASLGYLQSLQRDRRTEQGWKTPKGGRIELSVKRWGVFVSNALYVGENLMPFWDIYGSALYANSPFYGTTRNLYNRTTVGYDRRFFNDTVGVYAGLIFQYDGQSLGLHQVVRLSVNLQKTVYRPKK